MTLRRMPGRRLMSVLFALCAAGGVSACRFSETPCAEGAPPTLRLAVGTLLPTNLRNHPVVRATAFTGTQLLRLDDRGRPAPGLADTWHTADRRVWTLELHPGLRSHDGQPVTAERLRAIFESPRFRQDPYWREVQQLEAPTPTTLVFHLARPTSAFPAALEAAAIDPELSTGPFRLLEDTDTHRVYEAFPGFWGGPPTLAGIRIDFYKTPRAAWAALLRNDADFLYDVPPEALPLLVRNPDIRLRAARPLQVLTLGFQVGRSRLRDVRIRRAINLAINRDELAQRVFANYLEVTDGITGTRSGPFAPDYWAVEGDGPAWPYDPAQARALVREATGGTGDLELVCITGNQQPLVADLVAGIEAQLQRVHIRLRMVPLEVSAFGARMQRGDFDLFAVPMAAGFGAFFPHRFWHSESPARLLTTGYSGANAELDALYTAASEDAERAAAHAVLEVMYRDPPAAFLLPMPIIRAFRRGWHVPDKPKDIRYSLPQWTREISPPCGHL